MSTTVLFLLVALLAVGEFLLFGALAEAYRDLRQMRELSGLVDKAVPVELGVALGGTPSVHGLNPALDSAVRATVVYLSTSCATCKLIADSLNGGIPRGVWIVVITSDPAVANEWLRGSGFDDVSHLSTIGYTTVREFAKSYGTVIAPFAVDIEHGKLTRARTVPSVRQFYALVPQPLGLSRGKNQIAEAQPA